MAMLKGQLIDVIIPSYNGKHLLEKHLPSTIKNSLQVNKIIVVDDGSVDGTEKWLKDNYPDVVCLHQSKNQGFTTSVNTGVNFSKASFIVLLNNDVTPLEGYLDKTMEYFNDNNVFAVTFNEKNSSWPVVSWDGKLQFFRSEDKTVPRFSAWASGGSAIFNKKIWDKIGGFNEIYSPAYWEDIDIGYRAWKLGYRIIWDPYSKVLHEHEASYSKLDPRYINGVKQRNELLFNWINISDDDLKRKHLVWLFKHTFSHLGYTRIILSALARLLTLGKKIEFKTTDREVLSLINKPFGDNLDLSVIIVTYKSEGVIKSVLDSLKKTVGTYKFETIVVDNNSSDKSADIASKHSSKPLVIRNKENLGLSKAVNQGIKIARGKYILLLNPDTLPVGQSLKHLIDFAEDHPHLGAVAPRLLDFDGKTQPSCYKFPTIVNAIKQYFLSCKNCFNKYNPGNKTTKVDIAVMAALLIPSSVINRIGGLDERFFLYYEDIEYCRRLWLNHYPVYFYPKPKVKHIHGASGNFKSHLSSPLANSAKIYHGILGSFILNIILWIGQKWQKVKIKYFRKSWR